MNVDRLHDANLVGLNWLHDQISLTFLLSDESTVTAHMRRIRSLRIDDLHDGNIVSDAFLFSKDNCQNGGEALSEWVEYLVVGGSLEKGSPGYELNRKSVDNAIRSVIDGEAFCFCLRPAYGCSLVCICESVVFELAGATGQV